MWFCYMINKKFLWGFLIKTYLSIIQVRIFSQRLGGLTLVLRYWSAGRSRTSMPKSRLILLQCLLKQGPWLRMPLHHFFSTRTLYMCIISWISTF